MQLTLDVRLPDDETFESFYNAGNDQLIHSVRASITEPSSLILIHADKGTGCSHILHAACALASESQISSTLIPLRHCEQLSVEVFHGLEQISLVCIDDVDEICGNSNWEFALFDLINRVNETKQTSLLISAHNPVVALPIQLPDLTSRLNGFSTYKIKALTESEKLELLQLRAKQKGLELDSGVSEFILRRCERDIKSLIATIDALDKASLQHQRKLTIPFVKQMLRI